MKKVTVYRPPHPDINQNYTVFSGEEIKVFYDDDGSLAIDNWQTGTERGYARFAKGGWTYVCVSEPLPKDPS